MSSSDGKKSTLSRLVSYIPGIGSSAVKDKGVVVVEDSGVAVEDKGVVAEDGDVIVKNSGTGTGTYSSVRILVFEAL